MVTFVPPIVIVPGSESTQKATSAPKVISSPCAKFVRPVVPKIIDRPSAAIASSSENTMPPTSSCSACTPCRSRRRLVADREGDEDVGLEVDVRFSETCFGFRSAVPSGSVSVSILTVKVLPRMSIGSPGSAMSNDAGLVALGLADLLSDSSSTEIATPGTAWGFSALVEQAAGDVDGVVVPSAGGRVQVSVALRRARRSSLPRRPAARSPVRR